MYDFGPTWIKSELDSLVLEHIRGWITLPINTCVSEIISLPLNKCGLDIPSLVEQAASLRLSTRYNLKNSDSSDIKHMWETTSSKKVSIN